MDSQKPTILKKLVLPHQIDLMKQFIVSESKVLLPHIIYETIDKLIDYYEQDRLSSSTGLQVT